MSESDTLDCAWIVEFLLRQSDADKLTTEAFRTLPLPSPPSFRLRLAALLHRLTSDLSLGFPALHQLQVILEDTSAASYSFYGSLVEAYRAVAFDCLAEALSSSHRTLAAVVVTFCSRVAEIERDGSDVLASLPLRHLLEDVKAAAASGSGSLLLERNTKNGASDAIRACLNAVLNDSGPSFLEKEALDKNATTSGELCVEDKGRDHPDVKMIDVNMGSRELESASIWSFQVLHLMNKMNIPAPFRMALPTPPLPPPIPAAPPPSPPRPPTTTAMKSNLNDLSSEESEMESSEEDAESGHRQKRSRREAIVGPAVDRGVAHEDVGLKLVSLVPKEIPVIRKKNPVLQEGRMRGQAFVTFPFVDLAQHALVCVEQ